MPSRCAQSKDEGFGGSYLPKWYYNQKNLRCEQMVYQGHGGNDNQFSSQDDCEISCNEQQRLRPFNVVPQSKLTTENVRTSAFTKRPQGSFDHLQKPIKENKPIINMVEGTKIADTANELGHIGAPAPAQPM